MGDWSVRVEWAGPAPDAEQLTAIAELLAQQAAAVGVEANGNPSAQMAVQAGTVRQAFDTAARLVEAACEQTGAACDIVGADVATWEEFQRRQDEPVVPPLVGLAELATILKVSRQRARVIAQTHHDRLPEVERTSNGPLFLRSHAEEFARTWERKRTGRPRKTA